MTKFFAIFTVCIVPFAFAVAQEAEHVHEDGAVHDHGAAVESFIEAAQVREGVTVNMNAVPVPYTTGIPLRLDFLVQQKPANTPIPFINLEASHTRLLHVIGARSDLNEFIHIHPQPIVGSPGTFRTEHAFLKPGQYTFWSEIQMNGIGMRFRHPALHIQGDGPDNEKEISFGRNAIIGNYQVAFAHDEHIVRGRDAHLTFDVHTVTGGGVLLENYVGAPMHLVLIKDDLRQFIHAYPEEEGHGHALLAIPEVRAHTADELLADASEQVAFHVTFPTGGLYKAFVQFRSEGAELSTDEALTASFWIRVDDQSVSVQMQWWILLAVSAALMIGLSLLVHRYLKGRSDE